MSNFFDIESGAPSFGDGGITNVDLVKLSLDPVSDDEAITRAIKAITMLTTRVMTVDACIDIMRKREPFSGLAKAFDRMKMHLQYISQDCLKIYEFCVNENVILSQDVIDDDADPDEFTAQGFYSDDDLNDPDVAADPPSTYDKTVPGASAKEDD